MPLAPETPSFATLPDLMPQSSHFASQSLYSAGLPGGSAQFAQFPPEMLYFPPDIFSVSLSLGHSRTSFYLLIATLPHPVCS
jgi:hypothetical protein